MYWWFNTCKHIDQQQFGKFIPEIAFENIKYATYLKKRFEIKLIFKNWNNNVPDSPSLDFHVVCLDWAAPGLQLMIINTGHI